MPNRNTYGTQQDLEVVILRCKKEQSKQQLLRTGKTETVKKFDSSKSSEMRKLDESSDIGKIKKVNSKISQAIISGRTNKKMNRKELATKINVKPIVVEEFETGKAKYCIKTINKLERVLGIKLTGEEFK
jgi:putative transcription factor